MATGRREFRIHSYSLLPKSWQSKQPVEGFRRGSLCPVLRCASLHSLRPRCPPDALQRATPSQHTCTWHCRSYSRTISAKRSLCCRNSGLWGSPCSSCTRKHFPSRKSSPNGVSKALLNHWGHGATPMHSTEASLRGSSPVGWVRKRRKNILHMRHQNTGRLSWLTRSQTHFLPQIHFRSRKY